MTIKIIGLKILISLCFSTLFYKNAANFNILYFKFSLIDLIYKYNLADIFYLVIGLQLFLAIFIFFTHLKWIRYIFEMSFLLYLAFTISYLLYMNYEYQGCIDCSYGISYFHENFKTTIFLSIGLFLLYCLSEWIARKKTLVKK